MYIYISHLLSLLTIPLQIYFLSWLRSHSLCHNLMLYWVISAHVPVVFSVLHSVENIHQLSTLTPDSFLSGHCQWAKRQKMCVVVDRRKKTDILWLAAEQQGCCAVIPDLPFSESILWGCGLCVYFRA